MKAHVIAADELTLQNLLREALQGKEIAENTQKLIRSLRTEPDP
jgi:hypothetical protein